MANNPNPPAKAGETEIIAARKEAVAKLQPLFVESKDEQGNPAPGVFHTHGGIAPVVGASADNAKFVAELRSNPHARSLAIVAAARGNKNFPAALVAEFLSGDERSPEGQKWFADVYLGGLAEIFVATGVGLVLPPTQPGIDLARAARSVFNHLTDEERKKFGVGGKTPRRQLATDLLAIASEQAAPLTPIQQLCRWMEREMDSREERRAEKAAADSSGDAAVALPQASPKPEPAPAPAKPVIPDLDSLIVGGSAPAAPKAPRVAKKIAAVTPAVPVVAPLPALSAAEKLEPVTATTAVDEDRELVLAAIRKAADGGNVVAKAFLALKGEKVTLEEVSLFVATRKGLF